MAVIIESDQLIYLLINTQLKNQTKKIYLVMYWWWHKEVTTYIWFCYSLHFQF